MEFEKEKKKKSQDTPDGILSHFVYFPDTENSLVF